MFSGRAMSFAEIMPRSLPPASTTGAPLMLRSERIEVASSIEVDGSSWTTRSCMISRARTWWRDWDWLRVLMAVSVANADDRGDIVLDGTSGPCGLAPGAVRLNLRGG